MIDTQVVGILHSLFGGLRSIIEPIAKDYSTVVYLALAFVGGYFLDQKYPELIKWHWVLWGVIFFLMLRFI